MEIFKNGKHVILSFQQKDTCNSSENTNEWKKIVTLERVKNSASH